MKWKELIRTHYVFLGLSLVFIILLGFLLFPFEKGELLRLLNDYQRPELDVFFSVITTFGHGFLIILFCILIFLFFRMNLGITALVAYASSGLIAQVIKRTVEMPRPRGYLSYFEQLKLMPDTYFSTQHSFPSGHTTSAFAFFSILALSNKNKWVQTLCVAMAVLVGISRVYLLQHFFMDVFAGALLGSVFAVITQYVLTKRLSEKPFHTSFYLFRKGKA